MRRPPENPDRKAISDAVVIAPRKPDRSFRLRAAMISSPEKSGKARLWSRSFALPATMIRKHGVPIVPLIKPRHLQRSMP